MGEEHNSHEGEQNEQPEQETMSDATESGEETIKKEDTEIIIVLKVYMHCEACARKVARSLKGFPGVEDVMADSNEGIVRVKGKEADPVKVHRRVQEKSRREVELISPHPQPPPPLSDEKKEEDKEPPMATTIVLNVQMHCEACARVICKKLQKIKGVEFARTDVSNNQVAVTGIVDPNELVKQVYKKTKKIATIVLPPTPPAEETESKSDEKEKNDGENADIISHQGESKDNEEEKKQEDVKRHQIWPTRNYADYLHHYQYAYPPPPQIFSDENPNACSIM
ncbi:unnamed protein product [Rhodiola kirilowii]